MAVNQELQDRNGKGTEKFVSKTLKKFGYWAYNMPPKVNGQPCDVVGAKGGKRTIVWLVDAKHVEVDKISFTFDRIEANQISSMAYAIQFAKINAENVGFAIFFERTKVLYWFSYSKFLKYSQLGYKSISLHELETFEEVLENADNN